MDFKISMKRNGTRIAKTILSKEAQSQKMGSSWFHDLLNYYSNQHDVVFLKVETQKWMK